MDHTGSSASRAAQLYTFGCHRNGSGALEDVQYTACTAVQATLRVCKLETFSYIELKPKQALQRYYELPSDLELY